MKGRLWISIILISFFTFGNINISQAQGITPCNFNGAPVACPSGVPDGAVGSAGGTAPFPFVGFSLGFSTFPIFNYTPMAFMAAMSSAMSPAMASTMGPNTAQSQANVTNSVTDSLKQQPTISNPTQNLFTVFSEVPADNGVQVASLTNTLLTDLDYDFKGNGEPISDTKVAEGTKPKKRVSLSLSGRVHESVLFFDDEGTQETKKIDPSKKVVRDTLTGEGGLFRGITELFRLAKVGIRYLAEKEVEKELEKDIETLERDLDKNKLTLDKNKNLLQGRFNDLRNAKKVADAQRTPGSKLAAQQDVSKAQDAVDEAKKEVETSEEDQKATQDKLDAVKGRLDTFRQGLMEQEKKKRQASTSPFSFKPGFMGLSKPEEGQSSDQFQLSPKLRLEFPSEKDSDSFDSLQLNPKLGFEFPSKEKSDSDSFPRGGQVEQNVLGTDDGPGDFQQAKTDLLGGDDEGFSAPEQKQGSTTDKFEDLRIRALKQSDRAQAAFKRVLDTQEKLDEARLKQSGLAIALERALKEQKTIKQEPSSTARTLRLRNANQAVNDAKDALAEASKTVEALEKEYEVLGNIADKQNAAAKQASDAYFGAVAVQSAKMLLKSLEAEETKEEIIPFPSKDPIERNKWLNRARDMWDDSFGTFLGKGPPKPIQPPPFDRSLLQQLKKTPSSSDPSTKGPPVTTEQSFGGTEDDFSGPGAGFDQLGAGAGDFDGEASKQVQAGDQALTPEQQEKIKRMRLIEAKLALAFAEGNVDGDTSREKIKQLRDAVAMLEGKPILADLGIFQKGTKELTAQEKEFLKQKEDFVEVPSDFARDIGVDFGEDQKSKTSKDSVTDTPKKTEVAKETFQEVPSDFLKDIGVDLEKGLTTTPSSGKKPPEVFDKGSFDPTGDDFSRPGTGQDLLADDGGGFVADDSGGKNEEAGGDSTKGQSSGQPGQSAADRRFQRVQDQLTAKRKDLKGARAELAEAQKNLGNIQKNPSSPANRLARPDAEKAVRDAQAKVDGLKDNIGNLEEQSARLAKAADRLQKMTDQKAGLNDQPSKEQDEVQKLIDRAVQGDEEARKALGAKTDGRGGSGSDDLQKLLDAANKGDAKAQDKIYTELLDKAGNGDQEAEELLKYLEGLAILGGAEKGKPLTEQLRTQQREVRKLDREIRKLESQKTQAEQDLDQLKKERRAASAALGKGDSSKFSKNLKKFNDLGEAISKQKTKLDGINTDLDDAKETREAKAEKAVELIKSIRAEGHRDRQDQREAKKDNSSSSKSSEAPSFQKDLDVEQGFFDFGSDTGTELLGATGDNFQAPDPNDTPSQTGLRQSDDEGQKFSPRDSHAISDDETDQVIEDLKAEIEARKEDLKEFPGLDLRGMAQQAAKKASEALEKASFFQWETFYTTAKNAAEKEMVKQLEETPTAFKSETYEERRDRLRNEFPNETDDQIESRAQQEEQAIAEDLAQAGEEGEEVYDQEFIIGDKQKAQFARNIAKGIASAAGTSAWTGTLEDLENAADKAVREELEDQEKMEEGQAETKETLRMLQRRVDRHGLPALEEKLAELQNTQAQGAGEGDNQRAEGGSGDSDASYQGEGAESQIYQDLKAQDARNAAPVQPISFSNTGSIQRLPRQGRVFTSPSKQPLVLNSEP